MLGFGGSVLGIVPSTILTSVNLPKYENHRKFAQTFKECNSWSGIIFAQNKSFYGKTISL